MIFPERLYEGDTVGVISPAGSPDMKRLKKGADWLKDLGFRIRFGKHLSSRYGYLAGTDEERLSDFHEMFADEAIRAIICSRGGYGSARFVHSIDFELVRAHPKVFWGYSDVTYLHTAIRQKTGLVTFHGPMLASDLGEENTPLISRQLFSQLFQPMALHYDEQLSPLTTIHHGVAEGKLVGGNLSLLVSTLGTPYEIDTKNKLLLLEDINEPPYRVDRMLNQLWMTGKLQKASGFVLGDFHQDNSEEDADSFSYQDVFQRYLTMIGKPAVSGFLIGHCAPNFSVPLGADAMLDADRKQLWIQPGVM
ncbi:LD-carboxypeptidase [Sporolactobacillus sp. CPB3-1]|uniref:LD-carboxypeptidase n=1 Tax=Sporolactobacillus mangiferae TaxID=2940498 RepID=A0ABT0MA82_9BACL|nr:LD-carboxypeptidase [Sporolactobacillus mangiferae]MCL1631764.1 LD-carboxypeptidase [Sporolactobacillus mangiferae]